MSTTSIKVTVNKIRSNPWIQGITVLAAIFGVASWIYTAYINHELLPPSKPDIVSSASPNAIWDTNTVQSIRIAATPDFHPPYTRPFTLTISNPNSYSCSMTVQFQASAGFRFMPVLKGGLPENISVEAGDEYTDTYKIFVKDCPATFTIDISLSVYTINPTAYAGTEKVTSQVINIEPTK